MSTTADDGANMAFVQKSKKDNWQTPPEIYEPLNEHVGIDLDPCAGRGTRIGDANFPPWYRDGLSAKWFGDVFVNPPFSQKSQWLEKAVGEYLEGNVTSVVFLTPDSTDVASWWHKWIATYFPATWFATSRVDFVDPETGEVAKGVSFNTALSMLGDIPDSYIEHLDENGDLVRRDVEE